jgi:hypothetical protein
MIRSKSWWLGEQTTMLTRFSRHATRRRVLRLHIRHGIKNATTTSSTLQRYDHNLFCYDHATIPLTSPCSHIRLSDCEDYAKFRESWGPEQSEMGDRICPRQHVSHVF